MNSYLMGFTKVILVGSVVCLLRCLVGLVPGHSTEPASAIYPTWPTRPTTQPTTPPPPRWACDVLPEIAPWDAPTHWWESERGYFVQLREAVDAEAAGGDAPETETLRLRAVALLQAVAQRDVARRSCAASASSRSEATPTPSEDGEGTREEEYVDEGIVQLCVGLVDATAYSSAGAEENVAWASLHTDPLAPAAVIELDASCWLRHRSVSRCRPCALVPAPLRHLPLWNHSPLRGAFWKGLDAATMPSSPPEARASAIPSETWLRRINMAARRGRSMQVQWMGLPQLPELRGLELTGNNWPSPPLPPSLPAMPRLTELRLHDNAISALPNDFFSQTQRLEHVIFARNALTRLPKSIMKLKMLRLLDVTNPRQKGQSFHIDYIDELPNLQILGLENQKIIGDVMPILSMSSLIFLNMSGCELRSLGNLNISDSKITDMQVLDLSNNYLETIPHSMLTKFPKLTKLLLNGNELRILEHTAFFNVPKLQYLDVSQNHLKKLPSFPSGSEMKTLKAYDNVLESFRDNFWESCTQLETLDLSQNHLQSAPILKNQEKLQTLDLSYNELKMIEVSHFGILQHLKSIDISNNLLSNIHPYVLSSFDEIKSANFSNNKLWYVSIKNNNLEILDLSHNSLTSIPNLNTPILSHLLLAHNIITLANFTAINATRLQDVDVSYNKVTLVFLGNKTIENIDLSHNKLKYLPFESTNTRTVNLLDNPLNGDDDTDYDNLGNTSIWDSWFVWVLAAISLLAVISFLILLGVGIWLQRHPR